jgi:thiaminase/transcriptional activator TenA
MSPTEGSEHFAAGPHTERLWQRVRPVVTGVENLPFLDQLAGGSLDTKAFTNYVLQDGLYLTGYAKAMSLLAAKASRRAEARFWAASVDTAIAVEEDMHGALLTDARLAPARAELLGEGGEPRPSPTTLGYVSYLINCAATEAYAVGVAGVLPCFWLYAHMGKVLVGKAGALPAGHPYRAWIETYDSEAFDASTRQAVAILERLLSAAGAQEYERMSAIFERACHFELYFWDTAHALEGWRTAPAGQ